ncbi:MAG: hypothetical protein QMD85_05330 [Candidatus Aenigmarchaeota archaeon]|nr:hypothetical protein [Candidatus Aenigmarchaeota archaeon]MDI6722989.1 hypothetical protein [Candidatus Aenigmarchaeota archaeon]
MEEKELPFEYKAVEDEIKSFDIESMKKEVLGTTVMMPGSGEMLALKIILQCTDNFVLVCSGVSSVMARGLNIPVVNASKPAAFAKGLARCMKDKKDPKVVVFADTQAALSELPELLSMDKDVVYICYNNRMPIQQLARMMHGYAATASIAFHDDLIRKLKKAYSTDRFSYIEILSPNPSWGYEASNTVHIAKLATECLLWPVYEIDGALSITKRIDHEEPVKLFYNALKPKPMEKEIQLIQEEAARNWRQLNRDNRS